MEPTIPLTMSSGFAPLDKLISALTVSCCGRLNPPVIIAAPMFAAIGVILSKNPSKPPLSAFKFFTALDCQSYFFFVSIY